MNAYAERIRSDLNQHYRRLRQELAIAHLGEIPYLLAESDYSYLDYYWNSLINEIRFAAYDYYVEKTGDEVLADQLVARFRERLPAIPVTRIDAMTALQDPPLEAPPLPHREAPDSAAHTGQATAQGRRPASNGHNMAVAAFAGAAVLGLLVTKWWIALLGVVGLGVTMVYRGSAPVREYRPTEAAPRSAVNVPAPRPVVSARPRDVQEVVDQVLNARMREVEVKFTAALAGLEEVREKTLRGGTHA